MKTEKELMQKVPEFGDGPADDPAAPEWSDETEKVGETE